MIIKGGPRAKQNELSTHLLRADTNETVRVFDLHGVVARDLKGSLAEMAAIAAGSRCSKFLYHASISPGATTILSDEQWREAVARLEAALGLEGHQRAVVLHTKKDRQHAHIVWNRVDVETLKAAHHGHNYRTHEQVARSLERDFGLEHVQGVHVDRPAERPPRRASSRESQQEGRTGWSRDQAVRDITDAWQRSEDGMSFARALAETGYCLARGDRKDVVVLDPAGGVHGIARRVPGVRAADVRARFADLDPKSLPSIEVARGVLARATRAKARKTEKQIVPPAEPERISTPAPAPAPTPSPVPQPRPVQTPPPERYVSIRQVRSPPARVPIPAPIRPAAAPSPRPAPPSWAREPAPNPQVRPVPAIPKPAQPARAPVEARSPQHDAERAGQQQRQAQAAAAEVANLARFHAGQLAQLDAHHEQRLIDLVQGVEGEIIRHNGLIARFGNLANKGNYHRELAYLVAKRDGIRQREAARQERVRAKLKAAQETERAEADQRRALRERLERDALERRLADQRTQLGRDQKERPGLEGPGG